MSEATNKLIFKAATKGGKYTVEVFETPKGYRLIESTKGNGQYTSNRPTLAEIRSITLEHLSACEVVDRRKFIIELDF